MKKSSSAEGLFINVITEILTAHDLLFDFNRANRDEKVSKVIVYLFQNKISAFKKPFVAKVDLQQRPKPKFSIQSKSPGSAIESVKKILGLQKKIANSYTTKIIDMFYLLLQRLRTLFCISDNRYISKSRKIN